MNRNWWQLTRQRTIDSKLHLQLHYFCSHFQTVLWSRANKILLESRRLPLCVKHELMMSSRKFSWIPIFLFSFFFLVSIFCSSFSFPLTCYSRSCGAAEARNHPGHGGAMHQVRKDMSYWYIYEFLLSKGCTQSGPKTYMYGCYTTM
jgi:hypothetical protein